MNINRKWVRWAAAAFTTQFLAAQPIPGDPNYAAFWSQWTVTPSSLNSISPTWNACTVIFDANARHFSMQSDGTVGDWSGNIPWLTMPNNGPLVAGTNQQLPSPSNPGLYNNQCILHGSESSLQLNANGSMDGTVTVTFRTPNWSPAFNTQNCGYNPNDMGGCLAGASRNWGYDRQRWIWLAAYNGAWWGSYLVGSVIIQSDTAAPVISGVTANPTATTAAITWNTNEFSDTQVFYGISAGYGSASPLNQLLVKNGHSANLTGLVPGTLYYYQVRSKDASERTATFSGTFQTPATSQFTLRVSPSVQAVAQGDATAYTVSVDRQPGFTGAVTVNYCRRTLGASKLVNIVTQRVTTWGWHRIHSLAASQPSSIGPAQGLGVFFPPFFRIRPPPRLPGRLCLDRFALRPPFKEWRNRSDLGRRLATPGIESGHIAVSQSRGMP